MNSLLLRLCSLGVIIIGSVFGVSGNCSALNGDVLLADNSLPSGEFEMFSQNNITFYDPNECVSTGGGGGLGSLSGSTFKEKMWCALLSLGLDKAPAAGMLANSLHEGGLTQWEGYAPKYGTGVIVNGKFMNGYSFDRLYNRYYGEQAWPIGVGMFGFTSNLSGFLHYISDNDPNLIRYFEDTQYSVSSDKLLEMIDASDFDKLLQLELKYFFEVHAANHFAFKIDTFKEKSNAYDAAVYFAHEYERCAACGYNKGSGQLLARGADANKIYDELEGFQCSGGSSLSTVSNSGSGGNAELSTGNVASPDVTLIGDSIAVQSEKELLAKFPNGFFSKVGSRHSTSAGMCPGDEGGLSVLQKLSSESDAIIDQHWTGECESVSVGAGVLAKNVVWELGTNSNGANENTINEVISLIGKDRNLFLVTPYNGQNLNGSGAIADIYKKVAEDNPNVYIVDWRAAVENEPSKYVKTEPGMTVHPTDEGKKLLADLIYQAVTGEGMTGIADCNASVTGTAGEAIKETAIRMSWPEGTERGKWYHNSGVPEEFTKMAEKWGYDGYPSCSRFASMVILESGVDDKFESILRPFGSRKNNLYTLEDYFASSPNWKQVSYEESQPGDIIINHEHVEVYIGDDKKAHAGEVGSPSPLDNNGPHIDPLSERDKHGDYKWYRSTNSSGSISVSGSGAGCNVCSADGGGGGSVSSEIGEGGLTFEQAKQFMMNYGANKNNSSKIPVQKGGGSAWGNSGCNGDGGSNCVAFSAFFIHKFTDSLRNTGSGHETVKNMSNVDGKGQEPKVWAVFSGGTSAKPHTGVILGYHDGEWIVGHASCHDSGRGAGTGGDGTYRGRGTGVGFVIKSSDLKTAMMNYNLATPGFAYPKNVNVAAIEKYLETGE